MTIYLFSFSVISNNPMISIPILSHGSLTGMDVIHYFSVTCPETGMFYRFTRVFCNPYKLFPNSTFVVSFNSYFQSLSVLLLDDHVSYTKLLLFGVFALLELVSLSFPHKIITLLVE